MCVLKFFIYLISRSVERPPASPPLNHAAKKLPKQSSGPNAVSSAFICQAAVSGALCQEIHDAGYVADSGYLHILSAS